MGALDAANGFKEWLERGLGSGDATGGSSILERMEQRVEAQVMGRVRSLGARAGGEGERNERVAEPRTDRGAAETQRAQRADAGSSAQRSEDRAERGRAEHDEHAEGGANGAASHAAPRTAPRAPSLEGRARSLQAADAADASAADAPAPDGTPQSGASFAAPALPSAQQGPPAAASAPGTRSAVLPSGAPAGVAAPAHATASAPPSSPPNSPHGAAAEALRAAAGTKLAAAAEPTPRSATAEDLELAEKVMSQLRARLQFGQREALIELRPSELGRIGVHLRFEDGALTATIRAERPETLAVLEAHAPELRAWLAQDGAEVREIDLGLADRGALFEKPQQRHHDKAHGRSSATAREPRGSAAVAATPRTNTGNSTPGIDMPSVDMLV